jgi:hypothetical protein
MTPQRERAPKALPTLAYFINLQACLLEMRRVLKAQGKVALVVSKEHTSWALTSRQVLRKFDMAGSIVEMATARQYGIDFRHERTIDIELHKMDFAARPGAKGAYSEIDYYSSKMLRDMCKLAIRSSSYCISRVVSTGVTTADAPAVETMGVFR